MIKEFVSAIKDTKDCYVAVQRKVARYVKKIVRHAKNSLACNARE